MQRKLLLHAIYHCPSPCHQAHAFRAHTGDPTSTQDCLRAPDCQDYVSSASVNAAVTKEEGW